MSTKVTPSCTIRSPKLVSARTEKVTSQPASSSIAQERKDGKAPMHSCSKDQTVSQKTTATRRCSLGCVRLSRTPQLVRADPWHTA